MADGVRTSASRPSPRHATPLLLRAAIEAAEVLGVEQHATPEQVRRAYKKLALKYHPDKQSSADAAAREAAEREMARLNWAKVRWEEGSVAADAKVGGGDLEGRRARETPFLSASHARRSVRLGVLQEVLSAKARD